MRSPSLVCLLDAALGIFAVAFVLDDLLAVTGQNREYGLVKLEHCALR